MRKWNHSTEPEGCVSISAPRRIAVLSILAITSLSWAAEAATLSTGTFWEFRWNETVTSFSSAGTSTDRDAGLFRVTLGPASTIQGRTAFSVSVAGRPPGTFRWSYIVPDGLGFLGSQDGSTLTTLFDPTRASWTGDGFLEGFAGFERVSDVVWGPGFVDNGYVVGNAAETHASANKDQCETIGGVTICDDTSYHHDWYEYYTDNLGPVASQHDWSASFSGGGFSSVHNGLRDIGMVASSLRGDPIQFGLEVEPNPLASPMPLPSFADTIGFAAAFDESDPISIQLPGGAQATANVHDWYSFTLTSPGQVRFDLVWDSRTGTSDLDLVLYQLQPFPLGNRVIAYSIDDNIQSGIEAETLQAFLTSVPFGSYLLGVSAFDTDGGPVEYTLHAVPAPEAFALEAATLGALCLLAAAKKRRTDWRWRSAVHPANAAKAPRGY